MSESDLQSDRPDVISGVTHKIKIPTADGEYKFYVTINRLGDGTPYEVFVNCKDAKYLEHMTATAVLTSTLLQEGVDIEVIAKKLESIHSPITGHIAKGGWVPSLHARIGRLLAG